MFKWHTWFKRGQKSIQDGPRSGYRKMISGKLETHYQRRCLGSFPNTTRLGTRPYFKDGLIITRSVTTRLGTRPYFKDGLIITRSVSEKMDNILKNFEVLVLCAPAYRYYDNALIERRHDVNVMACSG